MLSPKIVRRVKFWRVLCMAFSAFIFNTTEFLPVALLSDIAESFQMSVSQTGLIITIYAWIVSLLSLPFMLLTAKIERRGLLIKLFILFILSHILSCIAWNFQILVISRIGIAISHSIFGLLLHHLRYVLLQEIKSTSTWFVSNGKCFSNGIRITIRTYYWSMVRVENNFWRDWYCSLCCLNIFV